MVWVRKKESVEGEEEQIHQVGDQVDGEGDSAVYPPLVCEETGHHWVLQEFSARIADLMQQPKQTRTIMLNSMFHYVCVCSYTEEGSCKQLKGTLVLKVCSQSFLAGVNLELSMSNLPSHSRLFKKHEAN